MAALPVRTEGDAMTALHVMTFDVQELPWMIVGPLVGTSGELTAGETLLNLAESVAATAATRLAGSDRAGFHTCAIVSYSEPDPSTASGIAI